MIKNSSSVNTSHFIISLSFFYCKDIFIDKLFDFVSTDGIQNISKKLFELFSSLIIEEENRDIKLVSVRFDCIG